MQGLLAVKPNRSRVALPAKLREQRDQFLGLAAVAGPKDGEVAQVVLVGLPGALGENGQREPHLQDLVNHVLGREDAAGAFAGEEQPAGLDGSPRRLRGGLKIEFADELRRFQHLVNEGEILVSCILKVHGRSA